MFRHRSYHVQRLALKESVREIGDAALRDSLPFPVRSRTVRTRLIWSIIFTYPMPDFHSQSLPCAFDRDWTITSRDT